MNLKPQYKYDLIETLYSGQAFRWSPLNGGGDDTNPWHEAIIGDQRVRLRQIENEIQLDQQGSSPQNSERISDYLRLEDNLSEIYSDLCTDKYLQKAIDQYQGLHILRQEPWECLITFICSANNNIPRIRTIVERLCDTLGTEKVDESGSYHCFPTSLQINEVGEEGLRKLGLGFRAKYVSAASRLDLEGEINVNELRGLKYEFVLAELMKIPGVGDKVANCVMLFSLDQLNAFPVDVWVKRVLRENYYGDVTSIPDTKLREWAQTYFGRYSGYANQYLFHNRRLSGD